MPANQSDGLPRPPHSKLFCQREYSYSRQLNRQQLDQLAEEHCLGAIFEHVNCKIPADARSTYLIAFSPNGKMVASTHGDHKIYVCDVASGKLLHTLEGHPRTPWCLAFHPSCNDILASGCLGGEVRVWDLHGGSEKWATRPRTVITSLTFHPLAKVLVIAAHNILYFWDWTQPQPFASCATATKRERVRYVKFNRAGNKLITGIANLPGEPSCSRIMDAILTQRRLPGLETPDDGHVELRSDLLENWNMPPPPREGDSSEDAIRQAREYAEAVTLSTTRFLNLNNSYSALVASHIADRIAESDPRNADVDSSLMDWADSADNISGLDRDFWRTFRRLQMLCRQMEQQIQQSSAAVNPTSAMQYVSSVQLLEVQHELESSVISLLTRLQISLRSMELVSLFARDQLGQVQMRINEMLERMRSRPNPPDVYRVFDSRLEPVATHDRIHRQPCTICLNPAQSNAIGDSWNPQYCLWLLESSLQLTRQMQGILEADHRLTQTWMEAAQEGIGSDSVQHSAPVQQQSLPEPPGARRLRLRRLRHTLLQRENPYYARLTVAPPFTPFHITTPLMLRRNLRLQINSAASSSSPSPSAQSPAENPAPSTQPPVDRPLPPAEPHSSSEEDPTFPLRRLHRHRDSMLDRLNNILSQIHSHRMAAADNSDSSSDEGAQGPDHRRLPFRLQHRVERLRDLLNASQPLDEPQGSQAPLDRSLRSLYNSFNFYETSIRSRLGSIFGLSDSPSNLTHRIQCWDFSKYIVPAISNEKVNVAMAKCKIHNDGSVAVCDTDQKLMALVPSRSLILVLTVVSLEARSLGQVLHTCRFGPNIISLSFSPLGNHALVGMAASNRFYLDLQGGTRANRHTVAQIFRLEPGNVSPVRVRSISLMSLLGIEIEANSTAHPGVNTIRWLPQPGQGLVAGTNRGNVTICRPLRPICHPDGPVQDSGPTPSTQRFTQTTGTQTFGSSITIIHRRPPVSPMHRGRHAIAATQTSHPQTQTTGTQTWYADRFPHRRSHSPPSSL